MIWYLFYIEISKDENYQLGYTDEISPMMLASHVMKIQPSMALGHEQAL